MKRLFLIVFILLAACTPGTPEALLATPSPSVYVSQAGTGTDCTEAVPCSMMAGMNKVQAGGTVELVGTFTSAVVWTKSGTASQPITLQCATPLACTVNSGSARTPSPTSTPTQTLTPTPSANYYCVIKPNGEIYCEPR